MAGIGYGGDDRTPLLEPDRVYAVTIGDCCIGGEFTDRFVRFEYSDNEPDHCSALVFEHVRLNHWAAATFDDEVSEADA